MVDSNGNVVASIENISKQNETPTTSLSADYGSNTSSVASSATTFTPETEKKLTQSEVNELVGRVKRETADKVRKEFASSIYGQQPSVSVQESSNISSENKVSKEDMQQAAQVALHDIAKRMWAQQTAGQFVQKITEAETRIPDIQEKIKSLNLVENIDLVGMANNVANTAEVMYELATHPQKYANVLTLIDKKEHTLAEKYLKDVANSIQQNNATKNKQVAQKPIDQLSHSTSGVDSGTDVYNMSVSQLGRFINRRK